MPQTCVSSLHTDNEWLPPVNVNQLESVTGPEI